MPSTINKCPRLPLFRSVQSDCVSKDLSFALEVMQEAIFGAIPARLCCRDLALLTRSYLLDGSEYRATAGGVGAIIAPSTHCIVRICGKESALCMAPPLQYLNEGAWLRKEKQMLFTIAVILIVLWALGMVSSYTMGGLLHVLLVVAIVVVLIRVIQGRRVL